MNYSLYERVELCLNGCTNFMLSVWRIVLRYKPMGYFSCGRVSSTLNMLWVLVLLSVPRRRCHCWLLFECLVACWLEIAAWIRYFKISMENLCRTYLNARRKNTLLENITIDLGYWEQSYKMFHFFFHPNFKLLLWWSCNLMRIFSILCISLELFGSIQMTVTGSCKLSLVTINTWSLLHRSYHCSRLVKLSLLFMFHSISTKSQHQEGPLQASIYESLDSSRFTS